MVDADDIKQVLQNPLFWLGAYASLFVLLGMTLSCMRVYMGLVSKENVIEVLKNKKTVFARVHRGHGNASEWIGFIIALCIYHLYAAGGKCDVATERAMIAMIAGKMSHTLGMVVPTKGILSMSITKTIGMSSFYFSALYLSVRILLAAVAV